MQKCSIYQSAQSANLLEAEEKFSQHEHNIVQDVYHIGVSKI